jgi:ketosteroid isomerase-like protein
VLVLTLITNRVYRKGLRAVERGDFDELLRVFDDRCVLTFVGDTALGARVRGRQDILRWFERFRRLLPDPHFTIRQTVVGGPPWRQRLAAHVVIRGTVLGEPYENQFGHFLRLRWGKVVDDLIVEDTQTWARACDRLVAAGIAEAGAPPMESTTSSIVRAP